MAAIVITLNGEIYNYRELREQLKAKNHTFSTQTDTEVLLAAWAEWGVECLSRLNGMFAFAIWDDREQDADAGARSTWGSSRSTMRTLKPVATRWRAGRPRSQ